MPVDFSALANVRRLLLEARLKPIQGTRFQPTGFPNLGAATYDGPDGRRMLLVESAQSMANWLERAIFKDLERDSGSDELIDQVNGISFIEIDCAEFGRTSTLLESHRINTPYLWDSTDSSALELQARILEDLGIAKKRKKKSGQDNADDSDDEATGRVDLRRFYRTLLKYDLNSLIHGAFLEKVAGRFRVPRALSAFIEALDANPAESGGTKFDHIFPAKNPTRGVTANDGYTNVPYPKTEFAAKDIVAYFNLDLAQIRGYALDADGERLLIALSLFKVCRLLEVDWALRSNCKFAVHEVLVKRPDKGFTLPPANEVANVLPDLIRAVQTKELVAGVSRVKWMRKKAKQAQPAESTSDR
jgi:CRISPR-associated protein Csb1